MASISGKQALLLKSLQTYFVCGDRMQQMRPIVEGKAIVSLRVIEWFVTNYAKKHNTFYSIEDADKHQHHFFVFLNYRMQLKAYSKREFDPFCRRDRIRFYYTSTDAIVTTIGQLNFFRWAIKQGIVAYVIDHKKDIESDMNAAIRVTSCTETITSASASTVSSMSTGATTDTSLSESSMSLSESWNTTQRKKRRELSTSATNKVNKTNLRVHITFE
jgi:hypothetical protein